MKKIRHLLEYALAKAGFLLVDAIPLGAAIRLASLAGDVWCLCAVSRRRIARENLLAGGICSNASEAAAMTRRCFRHFAVMAVESLKSGPFLAGEKWLGQVTLEIPPDVQAIFDDPRQSAILASGHVGNWEIAAAILSRMKPAVVIARPMNNPYVDRLLADRRGQSRMRTIPKHGEEMGRLVAVLREGSILAFMIDQHARDRGMAVDFFGRPASTHTAIALLHLVTRVPIVFGTCIRTGPMKFRVRAVGPFRHKPTGDKAADIKAILEELNRELEAAIREYPEQYLWFHRRWRLPVPPQNGTR